MGGGGEGVDGHVHALCEDAEEGGGGALDGVGGGVDGVEFVAPAGEKAEGFSGKGEVEEMGEGVVDGCRGGGGRGGGGSGWSGGRGGRGGGRDRWWLLMGGRGGGGGRGHGNNFHSAGAVVYAEVRRPGHGGHGGGQEVAVGVGGGGYAQVVERGFEVILKRSCAVLIWESGVRVGETGGS